MIKLNSFALPDKVIEDMKNSLEESIRKEIELGFSLCRNKNDNILKVGEQCAGGVCFVNLPSTCEGDDVYEGTYHTHPHESSRISRQDIPVIYNRGMGCIGGIENDKKEIKCYIRRVPRDIEEIYRFKDKLIFIRNMEKLRSEIDNFIKDNFKVIDVL